MVKKGKKVKYTLSGIQAVREGEGAISDRCVSIRRSESRSVVKQSPVFE